MNNLAKKLFKNVVRDEEGVTLVEYGIAISLAIALGTSAFSVLATDVSNTISVAGSKMP